MLFPERGVHVSASFFLLAALALIVSPWEIAASVLLAALLHECGHLLALKAFRVPVEGLRLTALGAELYARGARRLSYVRELVVTLAGCGANLACGFLTALAARRLSWEGGFLFAGAHFLLAAFNLLPIPPLDGSRALTLFVSFFLGPAAGDAAAAVTGLFFALALVGAGIYIAAETGGGVLFLLASLALSFGLFRQVRLAKRERKV